MHVVFIWLIGLYTLGKTETYTNIQSEFDDDERSVSVRFWAYGWFISTINYKDCVTIKCWWWLRSWYNKYGLHADDYSSKNSVTDRYGGVL